MTNNQLNSILQNRVHGAVNIRGIRFQLLFALREAMRLYDSSCPFEAIGLERFEDIDFYPKPIQLSTSASTHYYQAKTSESGWVPAQLIGPLRSFLEISRNDAQGKFFLVFNFNPTGEFGEFVNFSSQKLAKQKAIRTKFRKLCKQAGEASKTGKIPALNITDAEADDLWNRLQFVPNKAEADLTRQILISITQIFGLSGNRAEEYLAIFFHHFALWSEQRKKVIRTDLDIVRDKVESNLAFEYEYAARPTLVKTLDWLEDAEPNDFKEGKRTRTGHIAMNLDVQRPKWHRAIKEAFETKQIVIVRASSGQGKSTLALRFVHEEWPESHTFIVQSAQTIDEAQLICGMLSNRVQNLQLPTFLLIDNANRRTQFWPLIAQECTRLGIPTLITVRQEDWVRFTQESLFSSALVDPSLETSEARELYRFLKKENRIHNNVRSPEWAWEKIGEPKLLMEYIFLLTHGRMLEDLLREQLADIQQNDKPIKLEILRRVVMADALGAPVEETRLFTDLAKEWGPAEVAAGSGALLAPMEGEYLQRLGTRILGLHWVRSDHLVRLLHDGYPTPVITALSILDAVAPESLADVIATALQRQDIDKEVFLDNLVNRTPTKPLTTLKSYLEGIFEAGEVAFFEANRKYFDEAFELHGQNGPTLLMYDWPPEDKKFLQEVAHITREKTDNYLQKLALISRLFNKVSRGNDACRDFLNRVAPNLEYRHFSGDIAIEGDILAWCGWCNATIANWLNIQHPLFADNLALDWKFPIDSLCRWQQGLWLYSRDAYHDWIISKPQELQDYLQWQLDCLELQIDAPSLNPQDSQEVQGTITLEYLGNNLENANKDTVSRIAKLYSLFPSYAHYNGQAFWPIEWPMAHDSSIKRMTQEYQYLPFIVDRNSTWVRVIESRYSTDTVYDFQKGWYDARKNTIDVLEALSNRLEALLAGQAPNLTATFGEKSDPERLQHALSHAPDVPEKIKEGINKKFKAAKDWNMHISAWLGAFTTAAVFFQTKGRLPQIDETEGSSEESEARAVRLTLHNFRDAVKELSAMQESMRLVLELTGDVFNTRELEEQEFAIFERALNSLEVWLEDRPDYKVKNLRSFLAQKREGRWNETRSLLHAALAPLEAQGYNFIYPNGIYEDFPLSYLPLMFEVSDPCNYISERDAILEALDPLHRRVDFGCVIPIFQGNRFIPGGFRPSLRIPEPDDIEGHKTREAVLFTSHILPDGVWELLPTLPAIEYPRLILLGTLHGLLFELARFIRIRSRILPLATSSGKFTLQLFDQHRNRLLSQPFDEEVDFAQIKQLFTSEFSNKSTTDNYQFAEAIIEIAQSWNDKQKRLQTLERISHLSEEEYQELEETRNSLWDDSGKLSNCDFVHAHTLMEELVLKKEATN